MGYLEAYQWKPYKMFSGKTVFFLKFTTHHICLQVMITCQRPLLTWLSCLQCSYHPGYKETIRRLLFSSRNLKKKNVTTLPDQSSTAPTMAEEHKNLSILWNRKGSRRNGTISKTGDWQFRCFSESIERFLLQESKILLR